MRRAYWLANQFLDAVVRVGMGVAVGGVVLIVLSLVVWILGGGR